MKNYFARTVITMLRALIMILMAPAFIVMFFVVAIFLALTSASDWILLHAEFDGDTEAMKKEQDRERWKAS